MVLNSSGLIYLSLMILQSAEALSVESSRL